MKFFIGIILMLSLPLIASAETKQFVCTSPVEEMAEYWEGEANSEFTKRHMKDHIQTYLGYAKFCRDHGKFGWKAIYTFDTRGLSNPQYSNSEEIGESCASIKGNKIEVEAVKLSFTPSTISFKNPERKESFNIDRKSLQAGYGKKRNFTCSVQDVDTSENVI
jgi:hypothetical protein